MWSGFNLKESRQLGRQYSRDPGLIDRRRDTYLKRLQDHVLLLLTGSFQPRSHGRTDRVEPLDLRAELRRENLPKWVEVKPLTREQHEAGGRRFGIFLVPYASQARRSAGSYRLALNMSKAGMTYREMAPVFGVTAARVGQMVRKAEKLGWAG